jgi:hypothetical protein
MPVTALGIVAAHQLRMCFLGRVGCDVFAVTVSLAGVLLPRQHRYRALMNLSLHCKCIAVRFPPFFLAVTNSIIAHFDKFFHALLLQNYALQHSSVIKCWRVKEVDTVLEEQESQWTPNRTGCRQGSRARWRRPTSSASSHGSGCNHSSRPGTKNLSRSVAALNLSPFRLLTQPLPNRALISSLMDDDLAGRGFVQQSFNFLFDGW